MSKPTIKEYQDALRNAYNKEGKMQVEIKDLQQQVNSWRTMYDMASKINWVEKDTAHAITAIYKNISHTMWAVVLIALMVGFSIGMFVGRV